MLERSQYTLRGNRQLPESNPGGIKNGIGDGGRTGYTRRLTGPHGRLVLTRHHQHVDFRHLLERQNRISAPFLAAHGGLFEGHALFQDAAGGLNHIAVDLMLHPGRVDHHPRIMANHHPRDRHFTAEPVNRHIRNPRRPCRPKAGELAMDVAGVGETAATQDIVLLRGLHGLGTRHPVGTCGRRPDQLRSPIIVQIAQAVFDRVNLCGEGQFIDIRFMGKGIGQRRHSAHPRRPHDRRHVVDRYAHVLEIIRRDRGPIPHFEHRRHRLHASCQQQGQGRRTVGGVTGLKVITGHTAVGIDPAVHFHQLRRALGLPHMLLLAGQLHPHRHPHGLGQQQRIGTHVIRAIAPITPRRLHANNLNALFRILQQPGQVRAQ